MWDLKKLDNKSKHVLKEAESQDSVVVGNELDTLVRRLWITC